MNLKAICRVISRSAVLFVGLAMCSPGVSAQTTDTGKALLVQMKNGDKQYFLLADRPLVTFADYVCKIETDDLKAEFDMAEIDHARVLTLDPASIEDVQSSLIVDLSNPSVVVIRGMSAGSQVSLFNLSGILLRQTSADDSGYAALEVGDFAAGVYVVTSKETTFKVYKK